jgi:hypothetical protein
VRVLRAHRQHAAHKARLSPPHKLPSDQGQ